jgi:hypothetical protein
MVNVPVRCGPPFGSATYETFPEPLPPDGGGGLVIDNQLAFDTALHAQPAGPFTAIALPGPPDAGTVSLVGDSVNAHPPS